MGTRARARVLERFTWPIVARQYLDLWADQIERSTTSRRAKMPAWITARSSPATPTEPSPPATCWSPPAATGTSATSPTSGSSITPVNSPKSAT
jgi:hypothetical protein